MKLFDEIGNEETVIPPVETAGVNTLEIGEVLSIEAAETDMNECAAEILAIEGAVATGRDTMATVEAQIAIEESILVKPEQVAASTVTLSYESMKNTAALLNYNVDALEISQEAMEKSPATALEISVEEKKNFVKDIIEKIKKALAVVWKKIKEFAGKAMLVFSGLEKKAIALQTEIKNIKGDTPKELSEGLVKTIKARNAALYINGGPSKVVQTLSSGVGSVTSMMTLFSTVNSAVEKAGDALGVNKEANAKAITELNSTIVDAVKAANNSALNSDDTKAVFTTAGSSFDAVEYKSIEVKDGYTKDEAENVINTISLPMTTISTKEAKFDVKPVSQKELEAMIGQVVQIAGGVKNFSKSMDSFISLIDKNTAALKGDKITDKAKAKLGQLFGTGLSGKLIAGHLAQVKNTMLLCNDLKNSFVTKSNEDIDAAAAVIAASEAAPSAEDLEKATSTVAASVAAPSVEDIDAAKVTLAAVGTVAAPSIEEIATATAVITASASVPSVEDLEAAQAIVTASEAAPSNEEIAAAKIVIGQTKEPAPEA